MKDEAQKTQSRQTQQPGGSRNDRLRSSKRGRRRRIRRREMLLRACAVILLFAVAALCFLFFFKVQRVEVADSSLQRYTDEQIAEASGIRVGENLFFLKTDAAAARILQALPYVESAAVRRRFPSTAQITVTYARPALAVPSEGGYVLLSVSGKVLQTGVSAISDYVADLYGAELKNAVPGENAEFTDPEMFGVVTSLAGAFADAGYLNVTAYDVSDLNNITVEVDYKIDVKLGNIAKVGSKLAFGKEVLDRSLADAKHASSKLVVDLTTENRAYVRTQDNIDGSGPLVIPQEPTEAPTDPSVDMPADTPADAGASPAEGIPDPVTAAPAESEAPPAETP